MPNVSQILFRNYYEELKTRIRHNPCLQEVSTLVEKRDMCTFIKQCDKYFISVMLEYWRSTEEALYNNATVIKSCGHI